MTEEDLSGTLFDAAIIGGGINGVGIAQDLALRGLKVVLLEKDDFAGHTTGASTKLIHGGLRYLEYLEFGLVRESLREREILLKNAPHLVVPLQLDIPVYKTSKRNFLTVKAGMVLYDLLSWDKSLPNHHFIRNARKIARRELGITTRGLKAVTSYYDCQALLPERLCVEVARSAATAGALMLNGHKVTACNHDEPGVARLTVKNRQTGITHPVKARIVVNAGGIFVDKILRMIDEKSPRKMGGTKGSHILLHKFDGGPKQALYIEAYQDGRPFFIIPWYDFYLVGTTDIYYDGDLDLVRASEEEIGYLLRELNHWLTKKSIGRDDIVYSYAGVRPLPWEPGKKESRVTRKHIIYDHQAHDGTENLISIIGGKLTTYRSLAGECGDLICQKLGYERESKTKDTPLPGAAGVTDMKSYREEQAVLLAKRYGLRVKITAALLDLYGAGAADVLALTGERPQWKRLICDAPLTIGAQVVFAIRFEFARDLSDILIRRLGMTRSACLGLDCLRETAAIAGEILNWSGREREERIAAYETYVQTRFKPALFERCLAGREG
ncbi:MAG TPA: glycerol-3-phosphate dehydrogenase [Caldithrix abyssi]|uniref:Glycerol-3-phosphate dehydrogenase n=1 Tax=Caldithrix abyssi TaxID=187145 RepID=A0A7V1PTI5_CALAY|nr:glycerol-3-phosphate dehydrogenase [Caldithrix abyssi]